MIETGGSIEVLNPCPRKGMYSLVKEVESEFVVLKTRYTPSKVANYGVRHVKYPGKYAIVYNNGESVLYHTTVFPNEKFTVSSLDRVRMFSFAASRRRV